jgi:hypothetical protein
VYVAVAALALGQVACDPTPEKIARWKETERGPRKLKEALADASLKPELRAMALTALVEIGMGGDALAYLEKTKTDTKPVVHEAVPRLSALLKGGDVGPAQRTAIDAKDTLFMLRNDADGADKDAIDHALIAWTTADLAPRMSQGGHSTEQILTAIGTKAAPRLGELVVPGSSSLLPAAQLLGKIGDADSRTRAQDQLIERIRRSGARGYADENLQAVGLIGGLRATTFLIDTAEHAPNPGVREKALLALGQGALSKGAAPSPAQPGSGVGQPPVDATAQAAALRIAGDKGAPGQVREAAFQLLEKMPTAQDGLVALMHSPEEKVRWRAVEAALAAGKDKAVVPVLEALNPAGKYKQEDLNSFVVHDLVMVGKDALSPLRSELQSKNPVAKKVAQAAARELEKRYK